MYFFKRKDGVANGQAGSDAFSASGRQARHSPRMLANGAMAGVFVFQMSGAPNMVFASRLMGDIQHTGKKIARAPLEVAFKDGKLVIGKTPHVLLIEGDLTGHGNDSLSEADLAHKPFQSTYNGLPCAYLQFELGVLLMYGDSNALSIKAITTESGIFTSEKSRKINERGAVFTSPDGILSFLPGHEQLLELPGVAFQGATVVFDDAQPGRFVVYDGGLGPRRIEISVAEGEPQIVRK